MSVVANPDTHKWTFLVYMAGDNNLSEDMISQLTGIANGMSHGNDLGKTMGLGDYAHIDFLAEYDGEHPVVATRRYDLKNDIKSPITEMSAEDDRRPTEEKIADFISWGVKYKPADHYALIISGHSDGFQGRTLLIDQDPQGVTALSTLAKGIKNGLGGRKLDILGFDSCVMSSLEVIYEFKDVADIWIGSEGSIPNYTWDYFGMANQLIQLPADQLLPESVARHIVDKVKEYNLAYAFQGRTVDICAGRISAITNIELALKSFFEGIPSSLASSAPLADDSLERLRRSMLMAHYQSQTFMRDQTVDLWDYCDCLIREVQYLKLPDKLVELLNAIKAAVESYVIKGAYTGGDQRFAKGISIYLPWSHLGWVMTRQPYESLAFAKTDAGKAWQEFSIIQIALLLRPDGLPILMDLFNQILTQGMSPFSMKSTTGIDGLAQIFGDGAGQSRDNPHKTKGMDTWIEYFGRVKNFKIDLAANDEYF
jgi:hypothetical protein